MKLNLLNVVSSEFDVEYIHHFCNHYKQYDIDQWNIIIHSPDGSTRNEAYYRFKAHFPSAKFYFWHDEFTSKGKIKFFNSIIEESNGYMLLCDIDELQVWPMEPKDMILKYGIVGGTLRDRWSIDNKPKQVEVEPDIFTQFPLQNMVSRDVFNIYTHVPCAFHSSYRLENSHDLTLNSSPISYKTYIDIAHFPWNLKRKDKAIKRIESHKKGGGNYSESEQILKLFYNG